MFIESDALESFQLNAVDGKIGKIKDFHFGDRSWIVHHLVVELGWIMSRTVIISPLSIPSIDEDKEVVNVNLTKAQVENSPSIDTELPPDRQVEVDLSKRHGWVGYWPNGPGTSGFDDLSTQADLNEALCEREKKRRQAGNHLRSMADVSGYQVGTSDGEMGTVETFLIDSDTWIVRYVVVGTRRWLTGKKVLIAPQWISTVDTDHRRIRVDLRPCDIESAPHYDVAQPLSRDDEKSLYRYYGRKGYW